MASKTAWTLLAKQPGTLRTTVAASRASACRHLSSSSSSRSPKSSSSSPSPSVLQSRCYALSRRTASPLRASFVRHAHSIPRPSAASPSSPDRQGLEPQGDQEPQEPTGLAPHYELTFTCKPCGTRSAHKVTKQGYHHGSVLITCPSCRNRHIISDHLGIFGSAPGQARTLEDILREQGQLVKKGTLGEDGDVEFWEDGTSSDRQARLASEDVMLPQSNKQSNKAKQEGGDEDVPGSTFQSARKA